MDLLINIASKKMYEYIHIPVTLKNIIIERARADKDVGGWMLVWSRRSFGSAASASLLVVSALSLVSSGDRSGVAVSSAVVMMWFSVVHTERLCWPDER